MKRKLSVILLVLFIVIQLLPLQVNALTVSKELKVSSELTQWVLDEPANTLYAISEKGKNLLFINATTMSIEKTLTLNGGPTDIIKEDGKLYISLDESKQIVIVDMTSKEITGRLYTSSDPYRIVKDGDKIYYTERKEWCRVFEYNLIANTDQRISVYSVSEPDLAINTSNHILYIGDSGSSSSNMTYYSTTDNKVIGKTNYDEGYGFSYPSRNTIFDGSNVYYAGRDFRLNDPTRFNGDFGGIGVEDVIYVNKGLVYTRTSIYDKDTHIKLGDYGLNSDLVQASDSTLYIYNKDKGTIKRYNDNNKIIDNSNAISLISGNLADPIPNNQQSTQINSGMSALPMKSKLIQWELNEPANTLYGISKVDKVLFFINAQTLDLEKSLTFACSPTDIIEDDGNLYIALDDTNQIIIVNMASKEITGRLYTSSDPYRIVKDGDKIYYTERDQHCNIYEYNLTTNTDQRISLSTINTIYQPDLAINTADHILYIGESGLSGSDMTYYSTTYNKVIGQTYYDYGYGFHYPGRYTIFDGEKVYYAGFAFDKQRPRQMLGRYSEEDITFVKYGSVFTKTNIYDSESYSSIGNNDFDLIEISDELVMFFYSEIDNSIVRIDQSKISNVQFNSQGGSNVDDIVVDNNGLIPAPVPPTRGGFKFDGWYKEAGCINPWNFTRDKVNSDTALYAKWAPVVNNGWCYSQGNWYFFNNGTMVTNAWRQSSSKRWFYLGADGAMVTNSWRQDSSKYWYYLGADGAMTANTWIVYNNKWYYLKANGGMATGWILYKGAWYYLYPSGEMAAHTIINGYRIDVNGVWMR